MPRKFCPHCKKDKRWFAERFCRDLRCESHDEKHFTFLTHEGSYVFVNMEDECENCHDTLMIIDGENFVCACCHIVIELSEQYTEVLMQD